MRTKGWRIIVGLVCWNSEETKRFSWKDRRSWMIDCQVKYNQERGIAHRIEQFHSLNASLLGCSFSSDNKIISNWLQKQNQEPTPHNAKTKNSKKHPSYNSTIASTPKLNFHHLPQIALITQPITHTFLSHHLFLSFHLAFISNLVFSLVDCAFTAVVNSLCVQDASTINLCWLQGSHVACFQQTFQYCQWLVGLFYDMSNLVGLFNAQYWPNK